jgi:hypothetical protein
LPLFEKVTLIPGGGQGAAKFVAVGDCKGRFRLSHAAMHQGKKALVRGQGLFRKGFFTLMFIQPDFCI